MSSIDRAFVAVVPPTAVLDAIDARVARLRAEVGRDDDGLRWSRREQWHITLRFLGRVADVDVVADAVRRAVGATNSFELQIGGGGAFPRVEQGTVVWIAVRDGTGALAQVAAAVEGAVVGMGFEPEPRQFAPHLTLARANRPHDLRALVDGLGDQPVGPPWTVDEVVLLSSDTRPTGAVYEKCARFTLS